MGQFTSAQLQSARWSDEDPEKTYKLLHRLDSGASGDVWLGENIVTGETLAIKIIAMEDELIEELEAEIGALSKCTSDFVIRYYGSYRKEETIWIVMEYADVGSLQDLVQISLKPLSEDEIRSVCASLLQGLAYLHDLGIIHRDVKAKNVLVNSKGRIKLADLGVSAVMESNAGKRMTAIGSPHWMAPEVIDEGAQYDGRADVWSLGITLIELAEMEPPYADMPLYDLLMLLPLADPPTLAEPEDWSDDLKSFLAACLTKDPEARPSAKELLDHPFVADEVHLQLEGHFDALKDMVMNSIERIRWFRMENIEQPPPSVVKPTEADREEAKDRRWSVRRSIRGSVASGSSAESRVSLVQSLTMATRRSFRSLASRRKSSAQGSLIYDGSDAEDGDDGASQAPAPRIDVDALRKRRKSKKESIMKPVAFLKSKHAADIAKINQAEAALKASDSKSEEEMKAVVTEALQEAEGAAASGRKSAPISVEDPYKDETPAEREERLEVEARMRKAEEVKARLLRLYQQYN